MSGGNIFLNYRRTDTAGHAGRIFDRLNQRFPGRVFRDVDGIAYGVDFGLEIERKLESCTALVVLIGPHWLSAKDAQGDAGSTTRTTSCASKSRPGCGVTYASSPCLWGARTCPRPQTCRRI